jgi:hypothetical protein
MFDQYNSNFSVFSFKDAVPCLGDCELYFKQICRADNKVISCVMRYLEYPDMINLRSSCKPMFKKIDKKLIKQYIRQGGITERSRKKFWQNNIDYRRMEEIILKENPDVKEKDKLYSKILQKAEQEQSNPDRKFFKVVEEIKRDLNRTFHWGKFQTEEGQMELGRVLIALAYIRPEIGYCQGMNFVAGALIHYMDDEEIVFWIFLALLDDFELNSLYYKVRYKSNKIEHA